MFKKITATTAALLLSAGVMSAATIQSADASGTDTGPCITAVWKDDPTIKAQRGNCPVEEPVVEDLRVPATWYSMRGGLQIEDPALARAAYRFTITNTTTGEVIKDVSDEVDAYGYSYNNWVEDYSGKPVGEDWYASEPVTRESMDSYQIELFLNGKTYSYTVPSSAGVRSEWDYEPDQPYGLRVAWAVPTIQLIDGALVMVEG